MNTLPKVSFYLMTLLLLPTMIIKPATAQSSWDQVAPYLEESTAAVASIDLKQIDVNVLLDQIIKLAPNAVTEPELTTTRAMVASMMQSLQRAGVERVYATVSMMDVPRGGFTLWLPCKDSKTVAAFAQSIVKGLPKDVNYHVIELEDMVVVSETKAWSRLSQKKNAPRARFNQVFSQAELPILQFAVELPETLQRDLQEVWPDRMPKPFPIPLSPRQFLVDVLAMVGSVRGSIANPEIELQIECQNAEAAKRIETIANSAIQLAEPIAKINVQSSNAQVILKLTAEELQRTLTQLLEPARMSAKRSQKSNDLKQIGLAIHMFADKYGYLPPRELRNAENKPLLSWRVLLLPFIGNEALYKEFHLNEPWDSEHNRKLIENMPAVYGDPLHALAPGMTTTQVPLVKGSAWSGEGDPLNFASITDGTSNTIAVIMVPPEQAVIWTKPDGWEFPLADAANVLLKDREFMTALFFDGSVRMLGIEDREALPKQLTAQGGEP